MKFNVNYEYIYSKENGEVYFQAECKCRQKG